MFYNGSWILLDIHQWYTTVKTNRGDGGSIHPQDSLHSFDGLVFKDTCYHARYSPPVPTPGFAYVEKSYILPGSYWEVNLSAWLGSLVACLSLLSKILHTWRKNVNVSNICYQYLTHCGGFVSRAIPHSSRCNIRMKNCNCCSLDNDSL